MSFIFENSAYLVLSSYLGSGLRDIFYPGLFFAWYDSTIKCININRKSNRIDFQ